jgi:hypothetical protein
VSPIFSIKATSATAPEQENELNKPKLPQKKTTTEELLNS